MRISKNGLDFIKHYEGFRSKAYRDVGGVWTCGYGHTRNVNQETRCDEHLGERWLLEDVWFVEEGVNDLCKVPLTQAQFDALVSFSYNVGLDIDSDLKAEGLGDSTLLKRLNSKNYSAAALEFLKWNKVKGKEIGGLTRRRKAESLMFEKGVYEHA